MTDYSAYDARMGMINASQEIKDNFIRTSKTVAKFNPSFKSDVLIEGVAKDLFVVRTAYPNEKEIFSYERGAFKLGELVVYQNSHWLIVEEDPDNDVYQVGRMKQCNYKLWWQNSDTLKLIDRWSVVENPYSRGLDESNIISTGGNQYRIKMQHDEETQLLHLDKRFLIGKANNVPIGYKTIRFDDITSTVEDNSRGFLTIVVLQDELQADDNWELMIANYKQEGQENKVVGTCEIVYAGKASLKSGGNAKTFRAEFKSSSGESISNIVPSWEVVLDEGLDEEKVVVTIDGGEIKLKVLDDVPAGKNIRLKMVAYDIQYGNFEKEILIAVEQLF